VDDFTRRSRMYLNVIHRTGAAGLGSGLIAVGLGGHLARHGYLWHLDTLGPALSPALSTILLGVGFISASAAVRGGRAASTALVVGGATLLVMGLTAVTMLESAYNPFAFGMTETILSLVAGALQLFVGAYGRFTGRLPADNYYRQQRHRDSGSSSAPAVGLGLADAVAARELAKAERAVAERAASPQQTAAVAALRGVPFDDRVSTWRSATALQV